MQNFNHLVEQVHPQAINWRRHLHKNPELSFNEKDTAQFIFDTLNSFPNLIISRPTPTSVMARLIGKHPGKTLAIRADIDALPLQELNHSEYKSQKDGVMHACGHDAHAACLLGTAQIISSMQDQIKGEVRFIFQHAEELPPGGAQQMVAAGVMENVDLIIGLHVLSTMPLGKIGIIPGPVMASPDSFEIEIIGTAGHAGHPHQAVDVIAVGAQVVGNLQHIVSRKLDPLEPAVISVTKFMAGTAYNILSNSALLTGTARVFNIQTRQQITTLMDQTIKGITMAHGANYTFKYMEGYSPVINNPEVTALIKQVISEDLGLDWIGEMRPSMGGEDFSAFLDKAPGCFLFVGAGNVAKGIIHPHHHPSFQIDEDALSIVMRISLGTIARVVL